MISVVTSRFWRQRHDFGGNVINVDVNFDGWLRHSALMEFRAVSTWYDHTCSFSQSKARHMDALTYRKLNNGQSQKLYRSWPVELLYIQSSSLDTDGMVTAKWSKLDHTKSLCFFVVNISITLYTQLNSYTSHTCQVAWIPREENLPLHSSQRGWFCKLQICYIISSFRSINDKKNVDKASVSFISNNYCLW